MYKAIVFAGTTEGYALCEFLAENRVSVYACADTEYGGSLLQENEFLHVSAGRLKTEDMEELFRKENPEIVLDATHPYAAEVTKNIRTACESAGVLYQRILRPEGEKNSEAIYVESTEEAAAFLSGTEGNIFLTTGSKEKPQIAEVIEVGPGEEIDGKKTPMVVKKGDKVVLNKYTGTEVKYEGTDYVIVRQSDILAIVE